MNVRKALALVVTALVFGAGITGAMAARRLPYTTTIKCGEISTAILTLGRGAQMCENRLDAIPAFVDLRSYQAYYKIDGAPSCDYVCLRPTYAAMKRGGLMRPLISGEQVTVLSVMRDPEDARYHVCYVRIPRGRWYVICDALADSPY